MQISVTSAGYFSEETGYRIGDQIKITLLKPLRDHVTFPLEQLGWKRTPEGIVLYPDPNGRKVITATNVIVFPNDFQRELFLLYPDLPRLIYGTHNSLSRLDVRVDNVNQQIIIPRP